MSGTIVSTTVAYSSFVGTPFALDELSFVACITGICEREL